jgi:hypothetical protein
MIRKRVIKLAFKGDTIRFEVQFKTFDGSIIDPTDVQLNIYDENDVAIDSILMTAETNKVEVGNYIHDYTLPYNEDSITYEFFGKYEGKPVIARKRIDLKFVY